MRIRMMRSPVTSRSTRDRSDAHGNPRAMVSEKRRQVTDAFWKWWLGPFYRTVKENELEV